jgi:hypothetical protein
MHVNTIYKNLVRNNLRKKYNDEKLFEKNTTPHANVLIESLIENKNTKYCARYRDCMIYDYIDEFLKRFYVREESTVRLPGIAKYYKSYLKFMCKPTLRNFKANDLLHLYADQKAELYQCVNYESKNRNAKEKTKFQTILTETVKEKINENIITKSELDCEDLQFNTESIAKDGVSISLDEHSLALLGFNEPLISHRSNNREESLLFLLGKFEDRKINEKFVKKNNILNENRQKISNYDKTTKDYSHKTLREHTQNECKYEEKKAEVENLVGKEVEVDLKLKLRNMIQDITGNTKTRNRNVYNQNQIATVSLSKENNKTNTQNKLSVIPNSLKQNKINNIQNNINQFSNKSKFNTYQSKYVQNPSALIDKLKKNTVTAVKSNKEKNLDFNMAGSHEAKVIFKSRLNQNATSDKNIVTISKMENKIHKTYDIKYIQSQVKPENNKNIQSGNVKKQLLLNSKKLKSNTDEVTSLNNKIKHISYKNEKKNANASDSKLLDNLYMFSTRIHSNIEKNQPKSRNPTLSLNPEKNSSDNYNNDLQINAAKKSFKINLNYPSNYDDLRNKIYGSFDRNTFLHNIITVTSSKVTNRQNSSNNSKSPLNNYKKMQPQIMVKTKHIHQEMIENKKTDSTCDKSNLLTYNTVKTKEIFSAINFHKNSGEKINNIKKEEINLPCTYNNNNQFNLLSPKDNSSSSLNNKIKINLMNAFNSCSKNSKKPQRIITSSHKVKFHIDKYEKNKHKK